MCEILPRSVTLRINYPNMNLFCLGDQRPCVEPKNSINDANVSQFGEISLDSMNCRRGVISTKIRRLLSSGRTGSENKNWFSGL